MDFSQYIDQAWTDHVTDTQRVAGSFETGISLLQMESQVAEFAKLLAHVLGQHLGRWQQGIDWLRRLQSHPLAINDENQSALRRYVASLEMASGSRTELNEFSISDRVQVCAMAANALSEHKQAEKTKSQFLAALELAQSGLSKEDPANRLLAVTGNNLAFALEEQKSRTPAEVELMILAAETGRKFWEIAGTWLHTERAEYRLAHAYLKAGNVAKALEHAHNCLEICARNSAPALELFFGNEALAFVENARRNQFGFESAVRNAKEHFQKLSGSDQAWCAKSLHALAAMEPT